MNKKILILCPYPENCAPSQRLKFEQYYSFLREQGFELEISPFMSSAFWKIVYKPGNLHLKAWFTLSGYFRRIKDLIRCKRYDAVYVHLWVTPFGFPLFERLLFSRTRHVLYDIDDLVYLKANKSAANGFIAAVKGRRKPIVLMQKARHVITCTPYLDEFVRRFNSSTTDISSTINTETYLPEQNKQNPLPIIGWSGSHSTSKYLYLLKDVLLEIQQECPFVLKVIGDPDFYIDGLTIRAIRWEEATEVKELNDFDIGVYPLPDEEWVLGKSGLKALQYMALEIPTVATAIGANFRVIEEGVSGYLVTTNDEWKTRLLTLLKDANLRRTIGQAARIRVEEQYSIHANRQQYLNSIITAIN
jgi:glycosyltransferase involved in cell wall biosynthesis